MTGTVTASAAGPVGGLVGYNYGSISQSYASGAVSGVNGAFAGGLVGELGSAGTIADSYALGSVTTSTGTGSGGVGGLVGWVDAAAAGITRSYSAGAVSGGSGMSVGGLIGVNKITAANSATRITFNYYDYQSAGVGSASISGIGTANGSIVAGTAVGMTTAQLKSALPSGFSSAVWASISGYYPLLLWQPGFISGTVYSTYGGTTLSGVTVTQILNGSSSLTAQTDSSGNYLFYLGPSGIAAGSDILVYTGGANGGVSYIRTTSGSASALNIYGTYLGLTTAGTSLTLLSSQLASATAGNTALQSQIAGLTNMAITSTGTSFAVDQAVTTGTLVFTAAGTVTQTAAITASNLALIGSGATFTLSATNQVTSLAASVGTGTVAFNNGANNFSIDTVAGITGITAATLSLTSTGTVSQTQAIKASSGGLALVLQGAGGTYNLTNASNSVATFAANTGSVNLSDSVSLTLNTVAGINNVTVTGALTLTTNSLTTTASTGLISAAGQMVTIKPLGTTTTMGLGTGTGTLALTTTTLGRITAGTLVFGSTANTGTLTIGGTVSLTNASTIMNLSLISGGTITMTNSSASLSDSRTTSTVLLQGVTLTLPGTVLVTGTSGLLVLSTTGTATATGAITATGLGLNLLGSGGAFSLTSTSNNITTLSASIGSGSINLVDNRVLSIGTVNGIAGITAGTFQLSNTNATTQSAAITVTNLLLLGTGGSYTLTNVSNAIGTIGANTGTVNVFDSSSLTVGTVGSTIGVTTTGAVTLASVGNLTIASTARVIAGSNANVVLSATGNFINSRGSDAISVSGTGRWLVYSAGPDNDVFGALNSNNTAIWNATYPTSVSATGNRYVFALAPVLTVTTTGTFTKTYGDDLTAAVAASAYTITGLRSGVTNAFLGDTAAVYSGAPVLTSTGASATADASSTAYSIVAALGSLASNSGYSFSFVNNGTVTVNPATLTFTADAASRGYGDANPALSGLVSGFKNGQSEGTFGGSTWSTLASLTFNVGSYGITGGLTNASPNYVITQAAGNTTALTINPEVLVATANTASRDYGDANPALSGSVSGFKNGQSEATFGGSTWSTLASLTFNVGSYGITGGLINASPNYTITQAAGNATALAINAATLTFTANAASRDYGDANPAFSGSIAGFKNGQTAATFGGDLWTTLADLTSPVGSYAVAGGLTNVSPNYLFVQAAGNLTALTINALPPTGANGTANGNTSGTTNGNDPSQYNSRPDPNGSPKDVNISFQNQGNGPFSVSFTPPPPPSVRVSNAPSTDVEPAALPPGQNLSSNNGLTYPAISQFDPNQYAQFKLPDFAAQAGEAAIFVMIARGTDQEHAADALIDGFWNGTSAAWTPSQSFAGKVTFSDGTGNTVNPMGNAGFPIAAGTTDFGQLLKSGPVMISNGATPAHWLLATQLTSDGKGIVANDPASGKQVVLNYDAATKTVSGVTSVFDTSSNKFVSFAEASAGTPALAGLQSYVPANFLAVSTK